MAWWRLLCLCLVQGCVPINHVPCTVPQPLNSEPPEARQPVKDYLKLFSTAVSAAALILRKNCELSRKKGISKSVCTFHTGGVGESIEVL